MRYDIEINKILEQFAMPVTGFSPAIKDPKKHFDLLYTIIQIIDPSPLTSVPDLVTSIYKYQKDQSSDNLLNMVEALIFMIPPADYLKMYRLIKGLNKQEARQVVIRFLLENKDRITTFVKNSFSSLSDDVEAVYRILATNPK